MHQPVPEGEHFCCELGLLLYFMRKRVSFSCSWLKGLECCACSCCSTVYVYTQLNISYLHTTDTQTFVHLAPYRVQLSTSICHRIRIRTSRRWRLTLLAVNCISNGLSSAVYRQCHVSTYPYYQYLRLLSRFLAHSHYQAVSEWRIGNVGWLQWSLSL